MNILLINHYAGSPSYGMEYRPYYMAREWVKSGNKVRIVASSESHLRRRRPELRGKVTFENIDGIGYVWLKGVHYEENNIRRVVNMAGFVKSLLFCKHEYLNEFNPDVVIASSTYPLDIYPAAYIAKEYGSKLIFEVHDLWPLSPMEIGGHAWWNPYVLMLQRAENYYCSNADVVVSILPNAKEHLIAHGMSPNKFVHVPNGVDIELWEHVMPLTKLDENRFDELKKQYELIVGYAGSHGTANALDDFIDAAERLRDKKIAFVLVGQGPDKSRLVEKAKSKCLGNVVFWDPVEKQKIPCMLDKMDILYIGWKKHPLYRFGISPNKLFDYMMAGKPIIHAVEAGNDPVAEIGCGVTCEPEKPDAIADAILKLWSMPTKKRLELGRAGREYVVKYHNYGVLAYKFSQLFDCSGKQ